MIFQNNKNKHPLVKEKFYMFGKYENSYIGTSNEGEEG